jgi:toxin YoeB
MTIHAQLTEQVQAKAGIGKPEPLVGNLSGYWSRRIDDTHRLVYEADDAAVLIIACRFHYNG